MKIPIVGGAYQHISKNVNAQICQNLYPHFDQKGGKEPSVLLGTPGTKVFLDLDYEKEVRAMHKMNSEGYAICGDRLYKILETSYVQMSGSLNTDSGAAFMADDGINLMIVDSDGSGWYLSGTTVTAITDPDFPIANSLTFQDTFFLVSERDTGNIFKSLSGDPTVWEALDFTNTEGHADNLLVVYSFLRELWAFGTQTIEILYNSGDPSFPFERVQGSFKKTGIGSVRSVAEDSDKLFFLGDDLVVYINRGLEISPISTPHIHYQFGTYSKTNDAVGYAYNHDGHIFYVLTFPTEGKTWVYDLSTNEWHTRASGLSDIRHTGNCYMFLYGKHLVGHYENGKILYYDNDTYTDDGEILRAWRTTKSIHQDRKYLYHHQMEVEFEAGVGLVSGQGVDPQVMLQYSDNGSKTWSGEKWRSMGKIGEHSLRSIWRRLGRSRDRVYSIMITDPIKRVIVSANLEVSLGTN